MIKERRNVSPARLGNNNNPVLNTMGSHRREPHRCKIRTEQWLSVPITADSLLRSKNGIFSTCVLLIPGSTPWNFTSLSTHYRALGVVGTCGSFAGWKQRRSHSGTCLGVASVGMEVVCGGEGSHSPPELRVLPQPEMRHWVPAVAQEVGRDTVATRVLMVAGEESLISMMSLFRVQLL